MDDRFVKFLCFLKFFFLSLPFGVFPSFVYFHPFVHLFKLLSYHLYAYPVGRYRIVFVCFLYSCFRWSFMGIRYHPINAIIVSSSSALWNWLTRFALDDWLLKALWKHSKHERWWYHSNSWVPYQFLEGSTEHVCADRGLVHCTGGQATLDELKHHCEKQGTDPPDMLGMLSLSSLIMDKWQVKSGLSRRTLEDNGQPQDRFCTNLLKLRFQAVVLQNFEQDESCWCEWQTCFGHGQTWQIDSPRWCPGRPKIFSCERVQQDHAGFAPCHTQGP